MSSGRKETSISSIHLMMERRNFQAMFSITLPLPPGELLRILGHDNNRGQQMVCRRQTIAHPRVIQ
ncbi:hypothetical protein [Phocaeicola vulgatus]|uniref:hypothetical protein n=1 Tax=Phocaeicola vulgatus TaxID=821 RepID=UPI00189DA7E9|nr:hypothetical protein [Phocaeicola vulgatus]MCS3015934.1 hypothetical protein [Phocaeicola vulgatus]